MTATTKYFLFGALSLTISLLSNGQTSVSQVTFSAPRDPKLCTPPKNRELFHDYINKEQDRLLNSDGKRDAMFGPSNNDETNFMLTRALVNRVDQFQCKIETDSAINGQDKVRLLRGMENLLKFFGSNVVSKKVNAIVLPEIITAFENCIDADKNGKSIEPIIQATSYQVGYSVVKADRVTFEKNAGFKSCQNLVILKYCLQNPSQTFQVLKENPDVPFADSMIRIAGKKYPRQLYDYAQASNKLAYMIRNINDDIFIQSVARMARSRDGQQYFPFLDNIVRGKLKFEEVDAVKEDDVLYYRLLVKTQIDYVERAMNRDTIMEQKALWSKIETRAREVFVNTINGLHEQDDPIRFRIIQPLTPEELYYLAVTTDGLIYTSSFVKGVYPLMMKKINNRSDSLLRLVMFDKYRKFIKMSAGYNTLSNFLGSFPNAEDASNLMRAFVKNLEKSEGLEDGVDVADSYASIAETIKPLGREMLANVQENYQRNLAQNNKKGIAMYNILQKLFLSADSTNKIDLTKELGIPPVYEVPYKTMTNDSGRVIMQVFFYGDKDGQGIFRGFVNMFSAANWKVTTAEKWVAITSIKGSPVTIYANKALPEEGGEDEKAQKALCEYLEANKLYPSITIHRGHSYYAGSTIEQMFGSSKIVFLGSCGGYHLIHDVLEKAPDAHIIASKQIGRTAINKPFFQLLSEKARTGSNVDWIPFWKEFEQMAKVEGFEDYIPPYENLGALFIKAYKIAMGEGEVQLGTN